MRLTTLKSPNANGFVKLQAQLRAAFPGEPIFPEVFHIKQRLNAHELCERIIG